MTAPETTTHEAREHFARWVRWYLDAFPEETPSQAALARKIGVSPSAVSQLLRKGSRRKPKFDVLMGFYRVLTKQMQIPVDALLFSDPPKLPGAR